MRMIDLESLKIFRTVVDEGGIVRAANKLNRVQSNVTTRIRQLEEHLGTRLFRREGRSIRLSAEGHTLLTYADRLLRLADETVSEMRTGKPKGVFRLGSLESTAGSRLAPILSRYHSIYPDVVVELATGTTGALVTRVMNFELEAAFVSEPFTAPGLQARRVFEERLVLVTSRAICKVSGPADLGRSTLIAFAPGCSYRKRIEEWLGSANVMPERIMEFASYQAMIACVAPDLLWCPNLSWRPCALPRAYANTRSLSDFRTTAPISSGMAIHRRRCGACYRFWSQPPYDGSPSDLRLT